MYQFYACTSLIFEVVQNIYTDTPLRYGGTLFLSNIEAFIGQADYGQRMLKHYVQAKIGGYMSWIDKIPGAFGA